MSDLVKRLRIKAGMIEMGEMIAWGSDTALMREAADALEVAAPDVQGEPVAFCENTALSIAERTFNTEVDEQVASDLIQYAQRLHSLYTAPQPDAALLEAFNAGWRAARRAAQAEAAELAGALDEMIEAADVASWGGYFPDAAITRAVEALAAYRKGGDT